MAVTDAKRRHRQASSESHRLIDGRNMRCPRCRRLNDILRYPPMARVEEFAAETNPIYKCPECRWVFSPALTENELRLFFGHEPLEEFERKAVTE